MIGLIIFGGINAGLLCLLVYGGFALPIIDLMRERRMVRPTAQKR